MDDTLIDWSQRSVDWQVFEREHLERVFNYIAKEVHPVRMPEAFYDVARTLSRQAWMEAEQDLRAPHLGTVVRQALAKIGVPPNLIDVEACLRAYDWQPIGGVVAYPDAVEILPVLVSHGVRIGLITNAYQPMWMRDRELEAYGLLAHFADCRLSAADVGYLKPHPAIFEAALQCLDIQADEAVFIGDNLAADVAGAQSIGMRAVLRVSPHVMPPADSAIIPDAQITTLHDLLPILDDWFPGWRSQPITQEHTEDANGAAGIEAVS
ncbi:MAG: HAD family hydrolase [Anaerolineae bacterium]|nr:HAD family hydrolase [Anaerolineae bacterium]